MTANSVEPRPAETSHPQRHGVTPPPHTPPNARSALSHPTTAPARERPRRSAARDASRMRRKACPLSQRHHPSAYRRGHDRRRLPWCTTVHDTTGRAWPPQPTSRDDAAAARGGGRGAPPSRKRRSADRRWRRPRGTRPEPARDVGSEGAAGGETAAIPRSSDRRR